MSITVREYQKLLEDVPKLKQQEAEAIGALDQLSKSLSKETQGMDLDEVRAFYEERQAELKQLEREIEVGHDQYLQDRERLGI